MATKKLTRNGDNKLFNRALSIINKNDNIDFIDKVIKTALVIDRNEAYNYINEVFLEIFEDQKIAINFMKYLTINSISKVKVDEENKQIYSQMKNLRILYKSFLQDIKSRDDNPFVLKSLNVSFNENGQGVLSLTRMDGFRGDFAMEQDSLALMLSNLINYSEENFILHKSFESDSEDLCTLINSMEHFMSTVKSKIDVEAAITDKGNKE